MGAYGFPVFLQPGCSFDYLPFPVHLISLGFSYAPIAWSGPRDTGFEGTWLNSCHHRCACGGEGRGCSSFMIYVWGLGRQRFQLAAKKSKNFEAWPIIGAYGFLGLFICTDRGFFRSMVKYCVMLRISVCTDSGFFSL